MDRQEFHTQLDEWTIDVVAKAKRLYDSGVAPERCLKLAMEVSSARMISKAEAHARARRVLAPQVGSRN